MARKKDGLTATGADLELGRRLWDRHGAFARREPLAVPRLGGGVPLLADLARRWSMAMVGPRAGEGLIYLAAGQWGLGARSLGGSPEVRRVVAPASATRASVAGAGVVTALARAVTGRGHGTESRRQDTMEAPLPAAETGTPAATRSGLARVQPARKAFESPLPGGPASEPPGKEQERGDDAATKVRAARSESRPESAGAEGDARLGVEILRRRSATAVRPPVARAETEPSSAKVFAVGRKTAKSPAPSSLSRGPADGPAAVQEPGGDRPAVATSRLGGRPLADLPLLRHVATAIPVSRKGYLGLKPQATKLRPSGTVSRRAAGAPSEEVRPSGTVSRRAAGAPAVGGKLGRGPQGQIYVMEEPLARLSRGGPSSSLGTGQDSEGFQPLAGARTPGPLELAAPSRGIEIPRYPVPSLRDEERGGAKLTPGGGKGKLEYQQSKPQAADGLSRPLIGAQLIPGARSNAGVAGQGTKGKPVARSTASSRKPPLSFQTTDFSLTLATRSSLAQRAMFLPSSGRTLGGPSVFPPTAVTAPRIAPTLSPALAHRPPLTSAVTAQPARTRTPASPPPEAVDVTARAGEAGLPAGWAPQQAAPSFAPLPLARRSTAADRIDRRASDSEAASAINAQATGISAAPVPAPPATATAGKPGEAATSAQGAANGGEDLESLTDLVYDRLMERLRIERESLGL